MSEAVNLLLRASAAYAAEIKIATRKLEKAEPDSDDANALTQRSEALKARRGEINAALVALGSASPDG
jgi:hypothetical protein